MSAHRSPQESQVIEKRHAHCVRLLCSRFVDTISLIHHICLEFMLIFMSFRKDALNNITPSFLICLVPKSCWVKWWSRDSGSKKNG